MASCFCARPPKPSAEEGEQRKANQARGQKQGAGRKRKQGMLSRLIEGE